VEVALIIIVAVLFALVAVIGLKGRGARRAAREREQGDARVMAEKGKEQHQASQRRQADVKAAHAERASEPGSEADE
jgi:hypothetical protein